MPGLGPAYMLFKRVKKNEFYTTTISLQTPEQETMKATEVGLQETVAWIEQTMAYMMSWIATSKGYVGLANHRAKMGGKLCILRGCTFPVIL